MLKIYGRKSSFNVQKVLWLVAELGIEHEHIEVGGQFGGLDTAEFRAMNPNGRVPVVVDGGQPIWESHTILRYLAARYGNSKGSRPSCRSGFWPALWHDDDPSQRARADQWMDWCQTGLQREFLNGVFWGFYRTPETQRDMAAVNLSIERTTAYLRLLDQVIADNDYLLGDQLTLADIPAGTCLYRYYNIEIERPSLPNLERWYAHLQKRPAYRVGVMIPFADLFGRLDY